MAKFLEPIGGRGISGVFVGVTLSCFHVVCLFDFSLGCTRRYTQQIVVGAIFNDTFRSARRVESILLSFSFPFFREFFYLFHVLIQFVMIPFSFLLVPHHAFARRTDCLRRVIHSTTHLIGSHTNSGRGQDDTGGNSLRQSVEKSTNTSLLCTHHRLSNKRCKAYDGALCYTFEAAAQSRPTIFWPSRAEQLVEIELLLFQCIEFRVLCFAVCFGLGRFLLFLLHKCLCCISRYGLKGCRKKRRCVFGPRLRCFVPGIACLSFRLVLLAFFGTCTCIIIIIIIITGSITGSSSTTTTKPGSGKRAFRDSNRTFMDGCVRLVLVLL
mmetsp:Transcript_8455/g.25016  ORF Transcript_8455/g.25016 Transcript_8455/m.25016 type:complete len:325 (-) Transcript_8455:268-1242(-)